MNLGPTEVLVILVIVFVIVVPVVVGAVFLTRNRGLDDRNQTEAYPPGWEAPPTSPPPPPSGAGPAAAHDPEIDPGPPPAS